MKFEVGTIKTNVEPLKKFRKRSVSTSGGGSNGGKNRGGGGSNGGNDGDNPGNPPSEPREETNFVPDKSRLVMWFLLVVVMMTFGGLISAYIVIATNGVLEWKPFSLPFQVWISTILIFASSVSYHFANKNLKNNQQSAAKKWFLTTTFLGAAFVSSQMLVWFELVHRGVYVSSNPYAGFFYILTAIHALHVVVGIILLGCIVLRTWHETSSAPELFQRQTFSKVIGWYWHFMDGLWVVLLLLLGFWK